MDGAKEIRLIECPRDAMQGLNYFISTADKINYLNLLLQVGFDTLDFGSFVSAKAVPQMADTVEVLERLNLELSRTSLLAIVANVKGIDEALKHSSITYLGYPFSISETFQRRNTNTDIRKSLDIVEDLLTKCDKSDKKAVVYLSMAFGNPYGDAWNLDLVHHWTEQLVKRGVSIISLSDTIGSATPEMIGDVYRIAQDSFGDVEFGLHLHSTPEHWEEKINAAYLNGCRRYDSAIKGYGGCPMAADTLTGNIATEKLIWFLSEQKEKLKINRSNFEKAMDFSSKIFH